MLNRLTESLDYNGRALVLRAERQQLIASNIANADTPGYVARDLDFAQALRTQTGTGNGSGAPAQTQAGHIGAGGVIPGSGMSTLAYATAAQTSLDRNTVDMDRERASFADNTVRYESTLRFINGNVRTMLDAIKPHNQ